MKKIVTGIVVFFIGILPIFASTNTYERTEEDYRVPNDVIVTEERIPYIMTTPSVNAEEKIYDFADLFTDEEERALYQEMQSFISKDQTDLVLVTINENPKYKELRIYDKDQADMVYADDFYDYNDFGYANTRDGLLILIDMDNRYVYISGSGESRFIFTDEKIPHITDSISSYLSSKSYKNGISKMIVTLDEYYHLGTKSDRGYRIDKNGKLVRDYHFLILSFISFVCTSVVMLILYFKNKMVRKATSGRNYLNEEKTNLTKTKDQFVNVFVTRTRVHSDSSSGGGGGHSGSSGFSHSGGGSHF